MKGYDPMNLKKFLLGSVIVLGSGLIFPIIQTKSTQHPQAALFNKKTEKGTLTLRFDGAKIYGKDGNTLKSYPGAGLYLDDAHFKEGTTHDYYGDPVYMKWHHNDMTTKATFYNIGNGGYILGYNIASLNSKGTLSVYHNAYVYDKNGQRLKSYLGSKDHTLIRKGTAVNYVGKLNEKSDTSKKLPKFYYFNTGVQSTSDKILWPTYHTIKGKQYYNIGNGGYIKANNICYINGKELYVSEATVTIGKSLHKNGKYYIGNSKGKLTGKFLSLKEGQKVVVDRMFKKGRTFWRIKGTKDYLYGPEIKTFPRQALRY